VSDENVINLFVAKWSPLLREIYTYLYRISHILVINAARRSEDTGEVEYGINLTAL
jgi:hypothetical protein